MSRHVSIEDLADVIAAELESYQQEVADGLKADIKQVGKEVVQELKATSPKLTGDYAKGWKVKTMFENDQNIRVRIHNPKEYYLTHLLEYGHAKQGGGRVEGKPHIRIAEQKAIEKLLRKVKILVRG